MNARQLISIALLVLTALAAAGAAEKSSEYRKELQQAQAHQQAKRYEEALRACQALLDQFKDPAQVREVTWLRIETLIVAGQYEEAGKALDALAKAGAEDPKLQSAVALRKADVLRMLGRFDEARAVCYRAICSVPLEAASCQAAQGRVAQAYRAEQRWAEALGAARILYDAAGTEQTIREAAQVVAQTFLSADGNLGRANEFLTYQRFGRDGPDGKAGTDDDVPVNRLAEVKYPAPSAEVDKQFQAAIDAQPAGYEGRRARAYLYVYWGKPKEAAGQFYLAFKAADLAETPAAVQELVIVGMKAHTASFHGLDRIFDFVSYGPKGKSGKEDLANPFAGL
jgi:tetratricopeptide (TPR) repeat protein